MVDNVQARTDIDSEKYIQQPRLNLGATGKVHTRFVQVDSSGAR